MQDEKKEKKCGAPKTVNMDELNCCFNEEFRVLFGPCQSINTDVRNIDVGDDGRLLNLKLNLIHVCKGRKVTIGVLVCEGKEIRGFRVCEVRVPRDGPSCGECGGCGGFNPCTNCSVQIPFALNENNVCCGRVLTVKIVAHYSSFYQDCPCG